MVSKSVIDFASRAPAIDVPNLEQVNIISVGRDVNRNVPYLEQTRTARRFLRVPSISKARFYLQLHASPAAFPVDSQAIRPAMALRSRLYQSQQTNVFCVAGS
jgi:hypothetical protein